MIPSSIHSLANKLLKQIVLRGSIIVSGKESTGIGHMETLSLVMGMTEYFIKELIFEPNFLWLKEQGGRVN